MTALDDTVNRFFRLALTFTIMLIIAVPLIIFGAINLFDGTAYAACFAAGIIFVIAGFFGCPITWLLWYKRKEYRNLVNLVMSRDSTTIETISGSLGIKPSEAMEDAGICLENGYLPGYMIRGDKVMRRDLVEPDRIVCHAICGYCGASFEYETSSPKCPYCGRYIPDHPLR